MRARLLTVLTTLSLMLVFAPAALARYDGGQGWYGETTDKAVTTTMFGVIAFFPTVIVVLSLIQGRLAKRHDQRWQAEKRRAAAADWRGGW